jgi:hypothetical protein
MQKGHVGHSRTRKTSGAKALFVTGTDGTAKAVPYKPASRMGDL